MAAKIEPIPPPQCSNTEPVAEPGIARFQRQRPCKSGITAHPLQLRQQPLKGTGPCPLGLQLQQALLSPPEPIDVTGAVGLQPLLQHLPVQAVAAGRRRGERLLKQPVELGEQQAGTHRLNPLDQHLPAPGVSGLLQQSQPQSSKVGRACHGQRKKSATSTPGRSAPITPCFQLLIRCITTAEKPIVDA